MHVRWVVSRCKQGKLVWRVIKKMFILFIVYLHFSNVSMYSFILNTNQQSAITECCLLVPFKFDNVVNIREKEAYKKLMLPYDPLLGCHMHIHNSFMIQSNNQTRYIGEHINIKYKNLTPE